MSDLLPFVKDRAGLPPPQARSWDRRRGLLTLRNRPLRVVGLILVFLYVVWYSRFGSRVRSKAVPYLPPHTLEPMVVPGFYHPGPRAKPSQCGDIYHEGEIEVQRSFDMDDDIYSIVDSLKLHPMVDKHYKWAKLNITPEVIDKTWLRMAQSSVWLDQYDVYLTVTRIVFYTTGVRHWSKMSWLRGQIHDTDWNELHNHTIDFRGNKVTFPRIFDIPTPYIPEGGFYGPEDPRVVIEEGVEDAEPVIIFNMLSDIDKKTRAMHVHRPFSNDTQILTIQGRDRRGSEKNWAPFFYSPDTDVSPWPNPYIHFIYEFKPLQILKCHLLNGWCEVVYHMQVPANAHAKHNDTHGNMRGGTNFVPMTSRPGPTQSFVGFPRTHINPGCKDGFYRPALTILTATSPTEFHFDFMSDSLDFNEEPLPETTISKPCKDGRVLIANSISDWKGRDTNRDTMTLTFSVDDYTTEVLRLRGVQSFLQGLPSNNVNAKAGASMRWDVPSQSVLGCSVEAATNWTIARVAEGIPGGPGMRTG